MAKAKFSKNMLLRGLERFETVEAVALWLDVHRTTVWRKMRAWNIDMQQVRAEFAAREEVAPPASAQPAQVTEPAKVTPPTKPRNPLAFDIRDYNGSGPENEFNPNGIDPRGLGIAASQWARENKLADSYGSKLGKLRLRPY